MSKQSKGVQALRLAEARNAKAEPLGGSDAQPMMISAPLIIMFEHDHKVICHIHPPPGYKHEHYGLLVCDLVRHLANAFKVSEEDMWEWVDKERYAPTTEVNTAS